MRKVTTFLFICILFVCSKTEKLANTSFCETGQVNCSSETNETNEDAATTSLETTEVTTITEEVTLSTTAKQMTEPSTTTVITTETPTTTTQSNILEFKLPEDVCQCDLTTNKCNINCCCDPDCSNIDKQSFSDCQQTLQHFDTKFCHQTNFIYRNRTKYKVVQNHDGLFCIVRDNVPGRLMFKNRQIIQTQQEFKQLLRRKKIYTFQQEVVDKGSFMPISYRKGSLIWGVLRNEIVPFGIPDKSLSSICMSDSQVEYLKDTSTSCSVFVSTQSCTTDSRLNMKHINDIILILNPTLLNETVLTKKGCGNKTCIEITTNLCSKHSVNDCIVKSVLPSYNSKLKMCQNMVENVQYVILHNGTNGIKNVQANVTLKNLTLVEDWTEIRQSYKVMFKWAGVNDTLFEKSGNPGYLTGYPIISGKKVYKQINGTGVASKEAIELSFDKSEWLTVFGNKNGYCQNKPRTNILFKENVIYTCQLMLNQDNFTKDGCVMLQNVIFDLLLGQNIDNMSNNNYFNKYIATYGNSKPENTEDWVRVLVDTFPVISSRILFKQDDVRKTCKNVITNVKIDIVTSSIGSLYDPQSKIIGVSMLFDGTQDVSYWLRSKVQLSVDVTAVVNFIDVTEPAVQQFAETPGLEIRLPHDFFYPFFSHGANFEPDLTFVTLISILVILY